MMVMYSAGVGNRGVGAISPLGGKILNIPPSEDLEKIYPPRRREAPPPFFRSKSGKIEKLTLI